MKLDMTKVGRLKHELVGTPENTPLTIDAGGTVYATAEVVHDGGQVRVSLFDPVKKKAKPKKR